MKKDNIRHFVFYLLSMIILVVSPASMLTAQPMEAKAAESANQEPQGNETASASQEAGKGLQTAEEASKEEAGEPSVKRVAGDNRYSNAVAISKEAWDHSDTVVLTNGSVFSDSLTATPLAHAYDAPILLTQAEDLAQASQQEMERLGAKQVLLLGGEQSISEGVENQLLAQKLHVERIGGRDRFEVAEKLAQKMIGEGDSKHEVFLANADAFADSLSIAPIAARKQMPILLTRSKQLHPRVEGLLNRVSKIYLVGGEKSISQDIENELKSKNIQVERLSGANRYDVNRKLLDRFGLQDGTVYLASGELFSDALPTASLAAKTNKSMLLVRNHRATMAAQLNYIHKQLGKSDFTLIGGEKTVSKETEAWLKQPQAFLESDYVMKRKKLNQMPVKIKSAKAKFYSRPAGTFAAQELSTAKNLAGQQVQASEAVKLSNGKRYVKVKLNNGKQVYIDANDLTYGNRLIKSVKWYPQLKPGASVGWGCAGASSAMLLSSRGHRFNDRELVRLMANVPKKTRTNPYGQDGNIYNGRGFTQVVQPQALVPYLKKYDQGVVDISGASTDQIIQEVLNGNPVMYYGYTWSDDDRNPKERRNHVKIIRGYRDGKFDIYDPVYQHFNEKPGRLRRGGRIGKYDLGPSARISVDFFNKETTNPNASYKVPDRQFITIR